MDTIQEYTQGIERYGDREKARDRARQRGR